MSGMAVPSVRKAIAAASFYILSVLLLPVSLLGYVLLAHGYLKR